MSTLARMTLDVSLFALGGWLTAVSLALRSCMDEIATIKQAMASPVSPAASAEDLIGRRLPRFRGELFETRAALRNRNLEGRVSMLLFVDLHSALAIAPGAFQMMVHLFLHKIDGDLHVICGNRQDLPAVKRAMQLTEDYWSRTKIVLDSRDRLRSALGIRSPWTALVVDATGHITRVGNGAFYD